MIDTSWVIVVNILAGIYALYAAAKKSGYMRWRWGMVSPAFFGVACIYIWVALAHPDAETRAPWLRAAQFYLPALASIYFVFEFLEDHAGKIINNVFRKGK